MSSTSDTKRSAAAYPTVHDDGLVFPSATPGSDRVVDVFFDGQRVWSVATASHPGSRPQDHGTWVPWPRALRRFLHGTSQVELREHVSGVQLLKVEHQFGSAVERIRVVDEAGRPLAVDKLGHLDQPFGDIGDAALSSLLDELTRILDIVRSECGLPAFISYGALLGAVRERQLLGHDNDIDISYLSRHDHPIDVARESFHLQRILGGHGYEIRRFSAADFKVRFRLADGTFQAIDVFGAFFCDDLLHVLPRLRVRLDPTDIAPLSLVELEGREFPAPANPEKFLAAAYGPYWRVPDPAWRPQPDFLARRRLDGWLRGLRKHRDPWEGYHHRRAQEEGCGDPSGLAALVADRESVPSHVVDVGAGLGHDAGWFARQGHRVTALDYAYAAVTHGTRVTRATGVNYSFFNLYELRHVLALSALLARSEEPTVIYGRHILDALADDGREHFWRMARMALSPGGRLYVEFRTGGRGRGKPAPGRPHWRPLAPAQVCAEIRHWGGDVEVCETGDWGEEPWGPGSRGKTGTATCRLVARW